MLKIGYDDRWVVNVTTDGADDEDVGLPTKFTTDCVDHQIHLLVEESIKNLLKMSEALKKGKALVTHFSRASLSRQKLRAIQEELVQQSSVPL